MCTKWKRFSFKTIILTLLPFILYGCGSSSTTEAPAMRTINGVVSDSTAQLPFANATVAAYAIDSVTGVASNTPLSEKTFSDGLGKFSVKIPATYSGALLFKAIETTGPRALGKKTGSEIKETTFSSILRSVLQAQNVIISPATDMVFQYIEKNKSGVLSDENIRKSISVLEPFLGVYFAQTGPISTEAPPLTSEQQQLFVVTQAINKLVNSTTTIADLVTYAPNKTTIVLGEGDVFTELKVKISEASEALIASGAISGSFTMPPITPISESNLADNIPPSAPQLEPAIINSASVTLSWKAAIDEANGSGVTIYLVSRNGFFIKATSNLNYTDETVTSSTKYEYEVKARDAAGNLSNGSTLVVTTSPVYTISGKVTKSDGSGLASVYVAISGYGSGIFTTDTNGVFSIPNVRAGNYTLTPSISGYTFTPENKSISVTTENISNVNFDAVAVPAGSVSGSITYPPGTIIGGISYPTGTVIGGVTYPTATVVGGVTYPTGTVVGGVTYPNGVVIGGVSYPAGTIVGGVAYPLSTLSAGINYPNGSIIGNVTFNTTISGTVTLDGVGLYGVAVVIKDNITGATTTETTGSTGNYSFNNAKPGSSYTITSTLTGYTFSPITISVSINNYARIIEQNFIATANPL